jgi:hypothetical protein
MKKVTGIVLNIAVCFLVDAQKHNLPPVQLPSFKKIQ